MDKDKETVVEQKNVAVSSEKETLQWFKNMKYKWAIPLVFLLLICIYQYFSNNRTVVAHQVQIESLKESYDSELKSKLLDNSKEQLTLMMKSFVWAVRSSMIRKNNDEIMQYFYEMVQEKSVKEVILVDNQNMIIVSTNRKHEKKKFKVLYPEANLEINKITFESRDDSYNLIAPILSLDQKIGTLFMQIENSAASDSTSTNEK